MRNAACWLFLALGVALITLASPTSGSGVAEHSPDRNSVAYLREQYAFFQLLPPERQRELRKLDGEFNALDKDSQERLRQVLDNYNWWLTQLSDEDRKRVVDAKTSTARLTVIKEIKNREWVATLPASYREEFDKAILENDRMRSIDLIEKWRLEQRNRRADWLRETWLEGRSWEEIKPKMPDMLLAADVRQTLEAFVNNLETQLPTSQRDRLRAYRDQPPEDREWVKYLRLLVDLADRYPLMPGPLDGPRVYDNLPKGVRESLERADPKNFANKKKNLPKEVQAEQGRWPSFALAVAEYAKQHRITLTEPIVPASRADMPADVQAFLEKLEPVLWKMEKAERADRAEQARKDLAKLKDAEGKWPDYPRAIVEVAKQNKMVIPGWTLPGRNDLWDTFRMKLPRKN